MLKIILLALLLYISISADEMPPAKAGQCFTKYFFPPKYTTITQVKATKKILMNSKSIKYEVIPAKFEWKERRIKIHDGIEKVVTSPARYKTVYEKIELFPSEKIWRRDSTLTSPKAFKSCVDSAQNAGMDVEHSTVGTCFYEHYQPMQYRTVTSKILIADGSERLISIPAKYRTVRKKIIKDETTEKLLPSKAVYKKVKDKVVIAPARTEWRKTTCNNRGCNQSEVVCLIEVPTTYKEIEKRVVLEPAVQKKIAVSPIFEIIEVQELLEPAHVKKIAIPPVYKTMKQKEKVEEEKFFWTDKSGKSARTRLYTQCNKICLTATDAEYKTIEKKVLLTPSSSHIVKTAPQYKIVKVKYIIKPASFKKVVIPAEYKTIITERERTKGYAKWIPMVCESNMTPLLIKKVQQSLKFQGYYHGEIDGIWNFKSKKAVRLYQKANNLAVGKLSIPTLKLLGIQ